MTGKISVLGLICSSFPDLISEKAQFPLNFESPTGIYLVKSFSLMLILIKNITSSTIFTESSARPIYSLSSVVCEEEAKTS